MGEIGSRLNYAIKIARHKHFKVTITAGNVIMYSRLGVSSIIIGFFIGVFSGISRFMNADNLWVNPTIEGFIGDFSETIVEMVPLAFVQESLYVLIYETHLSLVLVGLAIIFFIIGAIFKKD